MGVKWTCALFFILGTVHFTVQAISPEDTEGESRIGERRALPNSINDELDPVRASFPINRIKRQATPQGEGNKKGSHLAGSSSSSSGNGQSWSNSWSSGSSSSGVGVGSRVGAGSGPGGSGYDRQQGIQQFGADPYYQPNYNSGRYNVPFGFDDFFQQYLRYVDPPRGNFRAPYQPENNSRAHAAAFMTGPNGGVQPGARVYSYSWSSSSTGSTGESKRGGGRSWKHHKAPNRAVNNEQRFSGLNNRLEYGPPYNNYYPNQFGFGSRGEFGTNFGNFDDFNQRFPNSAYGGFSNPPNQQQGGHTAQASASLGPGGGYQEAEIKPAPFGVESRFAEELPPSSGPGFHGTFTSVSSSSEVGPDGKVTHHKSATTGVNNNGKVSVHTVRDP